jgi:hypothetical protein
MIDPTPWANRHHRGRPTVALPLSNEQKAQVEAILRCPSTPQGEARRAQALLLLAAAVPSDDLARLMGVDERTVFKWKKRFTVKDPVAAIRDVPLPGRPRSLFRQKFARAS